MELIHGIGAIFALFAVIWICAAGGTFTMIWVLGGFDKAVEMFRAMFRLLKKSDS